MTLDVTEIIDRSEQGVIAPFLCQCEDGQEYYVKGSAAGREALICEWIGTNIAITLGLPVPKPQLVQVHEEIIKYGSRTDLADLGAGTWFGSTRIRDVMEITYGALSRIPDDLRATILLFDWWVLNEDRSLGASGGNPNLLWDARREQLHVIDHNQAFHPSCKGNFWQDHIFCANAQLWTAAFRSKAERLMDNAEAGLLEFWNAMPEDWYADDHGISYEQLSAILDRRHDSDFWRSA